MATTRTAKDAPQEGKKEGFYDFGRVENSPQIADARLGKGAPHPQLDRDKTGELVKGGLLPNTKLDQRADCRENLQYPHLNVQEKLKKIAELGDLGDTSVMLTDANNVTRKCRVEMERLGKNGQERTLVHLYATDEKGKEYVILRGIRDAKGNFEQERDPSGRKVSYIGNWWTTHMSASNLGGVEDPATAFQVSSIQAAGKQEVVAAVSPQPAAPRDMSVAPQPPVVSDIPQPPVPPVGPPSADAPLVVPAPQAGGAAERADADVNLRQMSRRGSDGRGHDQHNDHQDGNHERQYDRKARMILELLQRYGVKRTMQAVREIAAQYRTRGTGYFPYNDSMEGGYFDKKGQRLRTLEDWLSGRADYVSVAADGRFKYGTRVRIPELNRDLAGGREIPFRIVDTGSAFRGRGTSRIDICRGNRRLTHDGAINRNLTLQFLRDRKPQEQHEYNV